MKTNRIEWDDYFMGVAGLIAQRSTCCRIKVGAVLVSKEKRILATGYNGVTRGSEHCHEYFELKFTDTQQDSSFEEYLLTASFKEEHRKFSSENEIHAEANALLGNSLMEMKESTMYSTLSPCEDCAKLMKAAGVTRVVYKTKYDRPEGEQALRFLKRSGIMLKMLET